MMKYRGVAFIFALMMFLAIAGALPSDSVVGNQPKRINDSQQRIADVQADLQERQAALNESLKNATDNQTIKKITNTQRQLENKERVLGKAAEILDEKEQRQIRMQEFREQIRQNRTAINVSGKNIQVREMNPGEKEIIAGKINARTGLNLTADNIDNYTGLHAMMSNGRFAPVKIMPNTASEVALKKLRAKCIERNCTVELKEVGEGNNTKLAYEIRSEKDSRVLFLFKKKMSVKAEVDAENGEIISSKKPWWAFLAKEKNALDVEIENETLNQ